MMSETNTQDRAPSSDDKPLSDIHALTTTCSTATAELEVFNFITTQTGPQNEQEKKTFDFLFRLRWSFLDLRLKLVLE